MKYRLTLHAAITPMGEPGELWPVEDGRENWLVEQLKADFVFETAESLHSFIEQFSIALGGRA